MPRTPRMQHFEAETASDRPMVEDSLSRALTALRTGDLEAALTASDSVITTAPADPRGHALRAHVLLALGRLDEARIAITRALEHDASSVPAWIEALGLARRVGATGAALDAARRLTELAPFHAPFWLDLGGAAERAEHPDAAARAWQRALALLPGSRVAGLGLARAQVALGDDASALAALASLMTASASWPEAEEWLAVTATALPPRRAEALLASAAVSLPASQPVQKAWLATLKRVRADIGQVLAQAERLAALLPAVAAAELLAIEYAVAVRFDAALDAADRALAIDPSCFAARWIAMHLPRSFPHRDAEAERAFLETWRASLDALERLDLDAVERETAESALAAATAFHVHYLGEPLTAEMARLGRVVEHLVARIASAPTRPDKPGTVGAKVKFGFCSAFVRHHTVMKLFGNLLRGLDRERITLEIFHIGPYVDDVTDEFSALADYYHQSTAPLSTLAATIAARELDVLVYSDLGMDGRTVSLAALRLAPVQATLWGHPMTAGMSTVDVVLSSALMEPTDGTDHYREQMVALPNLGTCYSAPTPSTRRPQELATLDDGAVLAFMPQMVLKLPSQFDRAMARIAGEAPHLRFALTPFFDRSVIERYLVRLRSAFDAASVDFDGRIVIQRFLGQTEWLGLAARADFALDSFRWSGGNTSLEIFAFATPIVTLPGATMRSRHTAAMLTLMDIPELIAANEDDYQRIAVTLACSADFRHEMRGRIAERKARLYNDRAVIAAFNGFIIDASANVRGRAPEAR